MIEEEIPGRRRRPQLEIALQRDEVCMSGGSGQIPDLPKATTKSERSL
ncbi:hypothetical protein [Altererythrobacter sp. Root672]|nr:hypothetical protein [Altererythrobacter sp. Root672]